MVNNYKTDLVSLTNIKSTKDSILSGKITVDESSYFNLNIPYDNGYKIYVDRKLVKYEKTDLAFIGFETKKDIINSEIYEVKFDYDHQSGCINLIVIEHVLNTEE